MVSIVSLVVLIGGFCACRLFFKRAAPRATPLSDNSSSGLSAPTSMELNVEHPLISCGRIALSADSIMQWFDGLGLDILVRGEWNSLDVRSDLFTVEALQNDAMTLQFNLLLGMRNPQDEGQWNFDQRRVLDRLHKHLHSNSDDLWTLVWLNCTEIEASAITKGVCDRKEWFVDDGFFGNGCVYCQFCAQYSMVRQRMIYHSPCDMNPMRLVLCLVAVKRIYPITRDADYINPGERIPTPKAMTWMGEYDACFASLSAEAGYQAALTDYDSHYDILVLREVRQVLPIALITCLRSLDDDDDSYMVSQTHDD
jgi:hypothetical protein